jgi:hypothetical protein
MNTTLIQQQHRDGLNAWQQGAVFLLACAVVISRQPDAFFHAQFYAEGGHVFYADAYNMRWWDALYETHTGYFQTMPRLAAALALLTPLLFAPLVLNLIAMALQALPVNLLLSSRTSAWGSLSFRAMLSAMYLVLPNCFEVSWRIPNTQWLLALSALILLLAPPPRNIVGRIFDVFIVMLSGLSGPYCFPMLPISIFLVWKHRDPRRWLLACVLAASCLVQAWALLVMDHAARSNQTLGASLPLLIRMLGGQIYSATILGGNRFAETPGTTSLIVLTAIALGGTAIILTCFLKSNLEMRVFQLFSAMLLAASLLSPSGAVPGQIPVWQQLTIGPGMRYWFLPTLVFAWSLLWSVRQRNPVLKWVSAVLLCLMSIGIVRDWKHPVFAKLNFPEYAKRFEVAPAGATVTIPTCPEGWNMKLVKHLPN